MGHRGGLSTSAEAEFPPPQPGVTPIDPLQFRGFRYLLGRPPAGSRTSLGDDPAHARNVLQALYALLPLGSLDDNPRIPSGYTYLLQFIAHDLVDTTVAFWAAAEAGVPSRNMRDEALSLDTLYGGGPTACPIAFAPAGALVDYRTQLRLGQIGDTAHLGLTGACPFRDIARLKLQNAPPPSNVDSPSQVYLADIRNDDNTLVSQIAVLFSILHNTIAAKLQNLGPQACFAHASTAMMTLYHAVIREDLIARLLDPAVYQTLKGRAPDSPAWLWDGEGMPMEFSHGAFRVGHSMVRPFYQLNGNLRIQVDGLMGGPNVGDPVRDPLPSNWIVEWARFFELGGTPNYALKFSAHQQLPLDFGGLFAPIAAQSPAQLTLRDWLSAANARPWRIDKLIDAVKGDYPAAPFLGGDAIRRWLDGLTQAAPDGNEAAVTVAGAAAQLETDLPLPLYIILESQLDPNNAGSHMGPLGSIIVGEVIFRYLAIQEAGLAVQIAPAKQALGADWDRIEAVKSMPDLVKLAGDWGGLMNCSSVPLISRDKLVKGEATMSGVPTERFDVSNLDQWGRLIKSWATHLDYIELKGGPEPPRDYWVNKTWAQTKPPAPTTTTDLDKEGNPKPWCLPRGTTVVLPRADGATVNLPFAVAMTADDFQQRVKAAGVEISDMPKQYSNVVIVQGDKSTMVMRLPPKDTLQGSEDDLLSEQVPYPLRSFYSKLYSGPPKVPTDRAGIMELHANRIGEYTLNNCA